VGATALEACAERECSIHKAIANADKLIMKIRASNFFRTRCLRRDKSGWRECFLTVSTMLDPIRKTSERHYLLIRSAWKNPEAASVCRIHCMGN